MRGAVATSSARNKSAPLGGGSSGSSGAETDRRMLLAAFRAVGPGSGLEYMVNIGEGRAPHEPAPIVADDVSSVASLPEVRPPFLSAYSFLLIRRHFRGRNFNETFMKAYVRGNATIAVPDDELQDKDEDRGIYRLHAVNHFILLNQMVANGPLFNGLVIFCIFFAGILVGLQSYPRLETNPLLALCDDIIQIIFTAECLFKIWAEGVQPLRYFLGPERGWNNFDFWLVAICWAANYGLVPIGNVAFLRLLRLMRLLKLVGKVKQLQLIIVGLANGLSAVTYILLLMLLIFYLFAVMGVDTFRRNDPFHFGSLGVAMVTLFRMSTLEDWSDVMFINYFGCDSQYSGVDGQYYGAGGIGSTPYVDRYSGAGGLGARPSHMSTKFGYFPINECWRPQPQPALAAAYCILFVLLGAFVMLSLFIGAVCGGMSDALGKFKEEAEAARLEKEAKGEKDHLKLLQLEQQREREKAESPDGRGDGAASTSFKDNSSSSSSSNPVGEGRRAGRERNARRGRRGRQQSGDEETKDAETSAEAVQILVVEEEEGTSSAAAHTAAIDGPSKKDDDHQNEDRDEEDCDHPQAALLRRTKAALELLGRVRRAREGNGQRWDLELVDGLAWRGYLRLATACDKVATAPAFVNLVTTTIVLAGVVVGIQTELWVPGGAASQPQYPLLDLLDTIILFIFTAEVVFKVVGEGDTPLRYFNDSWNCFDFFIVAACWFFIVGESFLPDLSSMLAMLRLLRLLRVLKLVKALPQLRIIIEALISGFGSITFVTIILFMFFYLYANIGMTLFAQNDPMHFGNLQLSLLTLFRCSTLDDWTDVMYVNMYGCDRWEYEYGRRYGQRANTALQIANCNNPSAFGWVSALYMISFIVLGALVLLTLFIGIVATAMEEAKALQKRDERDDAKLKVQALALPIAEAVDKTALPRALRLLREIFDSMDLKGEGCLEDEESVRPVLDLLPLVANNDRVEALTADYRRLRSRLRDRRIHGTAGLSGSAERAAHETSFLEAVAALVLEWESAEQEQERKQEQEQEQEQGLEKKKESGKAGERVSNGIGGGSALSWKDVEKFLTAIDEDYSGGLRFSNFVMLVDFLRRAEDDPTLVPQMRQQINHAAAGAAAALLELPSSSSAAGNRPLENGSKGKLARLRQQQEQQQDLSAKLVEAYAKTTRLEQENRRLQAELAAARRGSARAVAVTQRPRHGQKPQSPPTRMRPLDPESPSPPPNDRSDTLLLGSPLDSAH